MRGVLHSEWTKLCSSPWCIFGLIVAALTAPMIAFANHPHGGCALWLHALYMVQAGIVIAAASFFGQEYSRSCLRTTFLAVPSRIKAMAAKIIILLIAIIMTWMVSTALGWVVLRGKAHDLLAKTMPTMISWLHMAVIAASLTVIMKSHIAPIAVMGSLILGLSQMLFSMIPQAKYLPDLATMKLFTESQMGLFLDVWQGIAVQFGWAFVLGSIALVMTLRHDVR